MLKVYNTLGRELQQFKPIDNEGNILIYHCGPTVYWTQHVGNLRAMTMGDLIRRSLEYMGYKVRYVRNYTDFGHLTGDNEGDADTGEDRIEKTAKKEKLSPKEVADKYISEFERDTEVLNIKEPSEKTRATDYIDAMKDMVSILLEKGYAYETTDAIYFDISKFDEYTKLSGQRLEENITGAGFGEHTDSNKKNPQDFAIWFFKTGSHKNALQTWPSDFNSPEVKNGEGIPGWHIECSAMARAELGDMLDIHIGGVEHIPIHHTNEIAQSEATTGKKYVNYWLHNEHLTLDGEKMSKSEGNVLFMKDILERGYSGLDVRYLFLQAHYRSKQNFTWEALEGAKVAYNKLKDKMREYSRSSKKDGSEILPVFKKRFLEAIEDDFNIPRALGIVWELIKSDSEAGSKYITILDFDKVLGLDLEKHSKQEEKGVEITEELQLLLDQRLEAKNSKNFTKADQIRENIKKEYGYDIIDESDGTQILKK